MLILFYIYLHTLNSVITFQLQATKINNTLMTILCPIPMHTFSNDTVYPAKIIQRSGQVEYPGCSIKNEYCAPKKIFYAWYDNDLQLRINRSPCCRKLLTDITLHTGMSVDLFDSARFSKLPFHMSLCLYVHIYLFALPCLPISLSNIVYPSLHFILFEWRFR